MTTNRSGLQRRTSGPYQGANVRVRGGSVERGEPVVFDLAAQDPLTTSLPPGSLALGGFTEVSAARATVRKPTGAVGPGARVGVMSAGTGDDHEGRCELAPDFGTTDVLVEALVEAHATCTPGRLLTLGAVGGIGCFRSVLAAAGARVYARLEQAATSAPDGSFGTSASIVRALVHLIPMGMATGETAIAAQTLSVPSGFTWTTPPALPRLGLDGTWGGTTSVRALRPAAGTTFFVDISTGSDANPGTASNAPLQSVHVAAAKTVNGPMTIRVAPGIYPFDNGYGAPTVHAGTTSIIVEPWYLREGQVYLTSAKLNPTWVLSSGTYDTAAFPFPGAVVDMSVTDEDGAPIKYALVADQAACAARRGTWYRTGTGGSETLGVNPLRDGTPGTELLALRANHACIDNSTRTIYLDGVTFIGGDHGIFKINSTGSAGGALYTRNVRSLACGGPAVQAQAVTVVHEGFRAIACGEGLVYNPNGTLGCDAIEIGCVAIGNGNVSFSDTANGSTAHLNCRTIRIGGRYEGSAGPNVADTQAGSLSWNVGCVVGLSRATSGTIFEAGFQTLSGNVSWYFRCTGRTDLWGLVVATGGTAVVDTCDFIATSNAGTLTTYTQGRTE